MIQRKMPCIVRLRIVPLPFKIPGKRTRLSCRTARCQFRLPALQNRRSGFFSICEKYCHPRKKLLLL